LAAARVHALIRHRRTIMQALSGLRERAMRIGFIGLGAMGTGIAGRLLAADHALVVWNRSPAAMEALVARGAHAAARAAEAARVDVLHTMLADDDALRAVLLDGGVLDALPRGSVHVNHATISVALARELAELHARRGVDYVAAPVFGRPDAAAAGQLHVLVAGDALAVARVRPLLEAIGQSLWPLGTAPERANVVKIAGNFMLAAAIEAMAEATVLGRAHGIDAGELLAVLTGTLFAAPAYRNYGRLIAERQYAPAGFALRLGYKDTRLTLAAAESEQVPMPLAGILRDGFLDALAHGDGELDWSALAEVAARRAHLQQRAADTLP
jgi:3-hydroxyisobutyrate dehydrogenase-like beta-hydroxyacid dehydrogenase